MNHPKSQIIIKIDQNKFYYKRFVIQAIVIVNGKEAAKNIWYGLCIHIAVTKKVHNVRDHSNIM